MNAQIKQDRIADTIYRQQREQGVQLYHQVMSEMVTKRFKQALSVYNSPSTVILV